MPLLKTITLGCKVNQYETEFVRQALGAIGYREVERDEPADLCIVNTCAVTAEGEAKSRKAIRHLARLYPRAEIVVMGCHATRDAEAVAALPGVVEVVTDKRQLPELLGRLGVIDIPRGISTFGSRHRAYVKVQDGCRMQCSYCIIPTVRSALSSRPVAEVLEEVRRLVDHGHREIVLTGIHLGHYGLNTDTEAVEVEERREGGEDADLAGLVRRIVELPGEFRVRISSIEASEVTRELMAVMRDRADRVCPHLHISMQSGSDRVLERMRRRWPMAKFLRRCDEVLRALDHPALTTDVIVGFPGETEADFAETCRVVTEVGFSKIHVFRFSPRQGTPAAEMGNRVPEGVKQERAAELGRLGGRLRHRYFESLVGRRLQVLVEEVVEGSPGWLQGTCCRYATGRMWGESSLIGRLVSVTAGAAADTHVELRAPDLGNLNPL